MPTFIIKTENETSWVSGVTHSASIARRADHADNVRLLLRRLPTPTDSAGESVMSYDVFTSSDKDDHTAITKAFLTRPEADLYAKENNEQVRHYVSRRTNRAACEFEYQTYWINADCHNNHDDICHYERDNTTRYEPDSKYIGNPVRPYITKRRRFSSGYPYRLEVNVPRHLQWTYRQTDELCNRLTRAYIDNTEQMDELQFNVDYDLTDHTGFGLRIDPKLLENCEDTPE